MSDRLIQTDGGVFWLTCAQCGDTIETYTDEVDLELLVGDAYSDHMHDDEVNEWGDDWRADEITTVAGQPVRTVAVRLPRLSPRPVETLELP